MIGVNKVTLIGNLGADPEIKKTASGQSISLFNVATSNAWTNREGQRQEHTEWHRVVAWGKLAETCSEYLSKGKKVYVEGRLQTRSWEDEKGSKRYTTEIVAAQVLFLSGNPEKRTDSSASSYTNEPAFNSSSANKSSQQQAGTAAEGATGGSVSARSREELPF